MKRSPLHVGYGTARVLLVAGLLWMGGPTGTAAVQSSPARIATVARPAPSGALATIPLEERHGWFIIEGRSEGGSLRFVFDTGSSAHGLTRAVVASLGLPRVGWTRLHGGSGSEPRWLVRGPDIWFGDATAAGGTRVLVDDDFVTDDTGVRYDGVIGIELLERYDVMIDAPGGALRLYRTGDGRRSEQVGRSIPLEDLGCGLAHFTIRIDGVDIGAILDTGASDLVLNGAAARRLGLMASGPAFDLAPRGIGDARIPAVPTRLSSLEVGEARFDGMEAIVADLALFEALDLADRPLVILGASFLEACPTLVSLGEGVISPCAAPTPLGREPSRATAMGLASRP